MSRLVFSGCSFKKKKRKKLSPRNELGSLEERTSPVFLLWLEFWFTGDRFLSFISLLPRRFDLGFVFVCRYCAGHRGA